jgi:beta-lactamase class A
MNEDERFSMQSVVKMVVGAAVMDAVDNKGWGLETRVRVGREDLSLFVQPIAERVKAGGFQTTVGDLVRRAIVESDSAASDILVRRLGGPGKIQAFLERKGISDVRVDRDERHLQTEIVGLEWRAEFVDGDVLERAIAGVPEQKRDEAYRFYQTDLRDTATPKGMAAFLQALSAGKLVSGDSTKYLLDVLGQTATFPDRLKAGLMEGWRLEHKTGTSGSWKGITAATNDVGILTAPDGGRISLVVFIADSHASAKERAQLMARIARATIGSYR